jgi:hypothetical protein
MGCIDDFCYANFTVQQISRMQSMAGTYFIHAVSGSVRTARTVVLIR